MNALVKANSYISCRAPAVLCRDLEKSLSERHDQSTAGARHGMFESKTAALCKSNEKNTIETLATRHGHGMLCVN